MSMIVDFDTEVLSRFPEVEGLRKWRQDTRQAFLQGQYDSMNAEEVYSQLLSEISPRLLTLDEIDSIVNVLPDPNALTKGVRQNISENLKRLLSEQLSRIMITPLGIPDLKREIRRKFHKSQAEPGSQVGVTAGEAMGQPITQMALNSFHSSGSAKNVGNGIETIREIVRGSKERKIKSMSLSFTDKYLTYNDVFYLRSELVGVTVGRLMKDSDILSYEDSALIPEWVNIYAQLKNETLYTPKYFLKVELNPVLMYQFNVSLPQIVEKIREYVKDDDLMNIIPSPMSETPTIIFIPNEASLADAFVDEKGKPMFNINPEDNQLSYLFLKVVVIHNLENKIFVSGVPDIEQVFPIKSTAWQVVQEEQPVYDTQAIQEFNTIEEQKIAKRHWNLFYNLKNIAQKGIPLERLERLLSSLQIQIVENPDIEDLGLEVVMPEPLSPIDILTPLVNSDLLTKIQEEETTDGWNVSFNTPITSEQRQQWIRLFQEQGYQVKPDPIVYQIIPNSPPIQFDTDFFTVTPLIPNGYLVEVINLPKTVVKQEKTRITQYTGENYLEDTLTQWRQSGYTVSPQITNPEYIITPRFIYSTSVYSVEPKEDGYIVTVKTPSPIIPRDILRWTSSGYDVQQVAQNVYDLTFDQFATISIDSEEYEIEKIGPNTLKLRSTTLNEPTQLNQWKRIYNIEPVETQRMYRVIPNTVDILQTNSEYKVRPAGEGVYVEFVNDVNDKLLTEWKKLGFQVKSETQKRNEMILIEKQKKPSDLFNETLAKERQAQDRKIKEYKGRMMPEPTQFLKLAEYCTADTNGSNLLDTFLNPHIDPDYTISNSFYEVSQVLGIEAARTLILREILDVFASQDAYLDPRHLLLLVDVMTNTGVVLGISYTGVGSRNATLLTQVSMEKTLYKFTQAASVGLSEPLQGASTRITVGAPIEGGTGLVSVIPKQQQERILDDTKRSEVSTKVVGGKSMNDAIDDLFTPLVPTLSNTAIRPVKPIRIEKVEEQPVMSEARRGKLPAKAQNTVGAIQALSLPRALPPQEITNSIQNGTLRTNVLRNENVREYMVISKPGPIASTSTSFDFDLDARNKELEDLFS